MRLTNVARKNLHLTASGIKQFLSQTHIESYQQKLVDILAGEHPPAEPIFVEGSNDTTHLSVMDSLGNVASITTSAGEGAGFMLGDTGVAMNNILGEIDLHPDGFHKATPGKRLQTMMSPIVALKGSKPILVLGSGGSNRLRSGIIQVLSNIFDFNLPLTEAVNLSRVHFQEGIVQVEGGIPADISAELSQYGYEVNMWADKSMYFGGVHSVSNIGGTWIAVGDSRRSGHGAIVT